MIPDKRKIKLIASDLDGTLLDSHKHLPEGFLPLLEDLLRQGVCFVAASGRQYFNILEYFGSLRDKIWFISENGGIVYRQGKSVMAQNMEPQLWQPALAAADLVGPSILSGSKSAYVAKKDMKNEKFAWNVHRFFARVTEVEELIPAALDDEICKIAVFAENGSESVLYPGLKQFADRANVVVSGPDWVDVMDTKVSKGNALTYIQRQLGIAPTETMVFGDYLNDVSLLENGSYAYAMENAHPELKKIATAIAPANDKGGVKKVLESIFA